MNTATTDMTSMVSTSSPADPAQFNTTDGPPHPPDSPEAITEAATLIVIMVASFFANLVAMTQIMTSPKLRKVHHNLLIFNLNVIDMGITLFSMPFSVAAIFDNGDLLINNSLACTINGFFAITCTVGNFSNVMCIAVDRYISIVWSTRFPPTRRRTLFMVAFVWTISIAITLPPTFEFLSSFGYTEQTHHCSPQWDVCSYYSIWFTFIFGVTVPVMIFCYVCVIFYIRKTERRLRNFGVVKSNAVLRKKSIDASAQIASVPKHVTRTVSNSLCPSAKECRSPVVENDANEHNDSHDTNDVVVNIFYNSAFANEELEVSGVRVIALSEHEDTLTYRDSSKDYQLYSISAKLARRQRDVTCNDKRTIYSADDSTKRQEGAHKHVVVADSGHARILAKQRKLSVEKQVACTGGLLVLTTICCWVPYMSIHFCYLPIKVTHAVAVATMWIAYLNALLDPLVYVFMNRTGTTLQYLSGIATAIRAAPVQLWTFIKGATAAGTR